MNGCVLGVGRWTKVLDFAFDFITTFRGGIDFGDLLNFVFFRPLIHLKNTYVSMPCHFFIIDSNSNFISYKIVVKNNQDHTITFYVHFNHL